MACLSGYVKNPYANTCIRLVEEKVTWSVAKAACESSGEQIQIQKKPLDGLLSS